MNGEIRVGILDVEYYRDLENYNIGLRGSWDFGDEAFRDSELLPDMAASLLVDSYLELHDRLSVEKPDSYTAVFRYEYRGSLDLEDHWPTEQEEGFDTEVFHAADGHVSDEAPVYMVASMAELEEGEMVDAAEEVFDGKERYEDSFVVGVRNVDGSKGTRPLPSISEKE